MSQGSVRTRRNGRIHTPLQALLLVDGHVGYHRFRGVKLHRHYPWYRRDRSQLERVSGEPPAEQQRPRAESVGKRRYPRFLVGTQKRERQKSNRQQRLIQEARAERVGTVKRTVLRWGIAGVAALGAIVFIAWIGGAFSGDDTLTDDPLPAELPFETTPVDTTPVPPKPEVAIPTEPVTDLIITDLVEGTGDGAQNGDTVLVHYVGVRSDDGVEFDNSYDRGSPFPVVLGSGGVIAGWEQGLLGVKAGGQRQLDIPADLAYGDADRGTIRPGDALTFVVDVVSVTPAGQ